MKKFLNFILMLSFIGGLAQANQLEIIGDTVIAETDAYIVHFQNGAITQFYNKLTAESYTVPLQDGQVIGLQDFPGIVWAGELGNGDESSIHTKAFELKQVSSLTVSMVYRDGQTHLRIFVSIDADTGELVVTQDAVSEKESVAEIWWSLNNLDIRDMELIVPADGGISFNASSPTWGGNFAYPSLYWEAQLVILQGSGGGFYVRSNDANYRYKSFGAKREDDSARLNFTTTNDAPFKDLTVIESVEWRLNTYSGGWRVPARQYRQWMERTFNPKPLSERTPWADKINFVFGTNFGLDMPGTIKGYGDLDPTKTLLLMGGFDEDASGNWVVKPDLVEFVEIARSYGYRIIIGTNGRGVFPHEPHYNLMLKYQFQDPWTGRRLGYGEEHPPEARHIFVNPASAAYRDFLVQQFKQLYSIVPFDGIFLDVNHLVSNDNNGLIDGLRAPQGNIHLQQALLDAFPDIVIMGEGFHEANFQQSFGGRDAGDELREPHPISAFLFTPYTRVWAIGDDLSRGEIDTYYRSLKFSKVRGFLPSLRVWYLDEHGDPNITELRKFLRAVGMWQRLNPQINLESDNLYETSWTDLFLTVMVPEKLVTFDLNNDNYINILDLVIVANALGKDAPDFNSDGIVNILDLIIMSKALL